MEQAKVWLDEINLSTTPDYRLNDPQLRMTSWWKWWSPLGKRKSLRRLHTVEESTRWQKWWFPLNASRSKEKVQDGYTRSRNQAEQGMTSWRRWKENVQDGLMISYNRAPLEHWYLHRHIGQLVCTVHIIVKWKICFRYSTFKNRSSTELMIFQSSHQGKDQILYYLVTSYYQLQ